MRIAYPGKGFQRSLRQSPQFLFGVADVEQCLPSQWKVIGLVRIIRDLGVESFDSPRDDSSQVRLRSNLSRTCDVGCLDLLHCEFPLPTPFRERPTLRPKSEISPLQQPRTHKRRQTVSRFVLTNHKHLRDLPWWNCESLVRL